jgi:hypothetical protein
MSNEKEKTALDYYSKKIMKLMMYAITKSITGNQFSMLEIKLFQESKEMEKEQIINTWSEATAPQHEIGLSDASYVIAQIKKAEQYYNETYGGDE